MEKMTIILAEDSHLGRKGQQVNLELMPSDVHDPTELPTYLAGYKPGGMRADEMSQVILVDNDEDKYRTFNTADTFAPVRVKGGLTGPIPEVDPGSSLATYKVVDRYVGSFVPKVTEGQTGGALSNFGPRQAAARRCRRAIDLDREIDVMTLLGTNTNWDASVRTAVAGGLEWDDLTGNSDPILDLQTAAEKSAQGVTGYWLNQKIAHTMLRHPKVRDHMRQLLGDGPAAVIANSIANMAATGGNVDFVIPGLPPFHVTAAKYNPGAGLQYILGDVVILVTQPDGVPMDGEEVASSYTFRRRGPSGVGFESREFVVEGRGPHGGTMVVIANADIALMTSTIAGGIITNVHT